MRFLKTPTIRVSLVFTSVFLLFILAACGGDATSPTTTNPFEPTPTLTPAVTTYTGNSFTIEYPKHWEVSDSSEDKLIVHYADHQATFSLYVFEDDGSQATHHIDTALLQHGDTAKDFHYD